MLVIWPMKSYEMWNKSEIILGCAEKDRIASYILLRIDRDHFYLCLWQKARVSDENNVALSWKPCIQAALLQQRSAEKDYRGFVTEVWRKLTCKFCVTKIPLQLQDNRGVGVFTGQNEGFIAINWPDACCWKVRQSFDWWFIVLLRYPENSKILLEVFWSPSFSTPV